MARGTYSTSRHGGRLPSPCPCLSPYMSHPLHVDFESAIKPCKELRSLECSLQSLFFDQKFYATFYLEPEQVETSLSQVRTSPKLGHSPSNLPSPLPKAPEMRRSPAGPGGRSAEQQPYAEPEGPREAEPSSEPERPREAEPSSEPERPREAEPSSEPRGEPKALFLSAAEACPSGDAPWFRAPLFSRPESRGWENAGRCVPKPV